MKFPAQSLSTPIKKLSIALATLVLFAAVFAFPHNSTAQESSETQSSIESVLSLKGSSHLKVFNQNNDKFSRLGEIGESQINLDAEGEFSSLVYLDNLVLRNNGENVEVKDPRVVKTQSGANIQGKINGKYKTLLKGNENSKTSSEQNASFDLKPTLFFANQLNDQTDADSFSRSQIVGSLQLNIEASSSFESSDENSNDSDDSTDQNNSDQSSDNPIDSILNILF